MLLSYMEQVPVYNAINFSIINKDKNVGAYVQYTAIDTRIASFLCPSSPLPLGNGESGRPHPGNNYFASTGPSMHFTEGASKGEAAPTGIFRVAGAAELKNTGGGPVGIRDVTDGTSNTIAFGEWRTGDYNSQKLSVPQDIVSRITYPGTGAEMNMPLGAANFVQWLAKCAGAAPGSTVGGNDAWKTNYSYIGSNWYQGMYGHNMGNTLLAPNPQYTNCRTCEWDGDLDCPGMYGMSSFHPGGGNVSMADGSVKFLKNTAAMNVIWSLGSRAGGEILSADAY